MSSLDDVTSLIHANFFFVDIVGLSDPQLSTKTQIKKIKVLNRCITECPAFTDTPEDLRVMLPTGDGCCIGFLQGPEFPLKLAIQLHRKLEKYNFAKIPTETVRIRIGLHNGNCFVIEDVNGQKNVWGPGIILARRVMDFGDDDHILLAPGLAEALREISDEYKKIIKPVHEFVIKHGTTMLVYSAFDGKTFGNAIPPTKGAAFRDKMEEEGEEFRKSTQYPRMEISMNLVDEKTNLIHYKRKYDVANISDKPINFIEHGIATDVEKDSIDDLNLKIYDENNGELRISSVSIDKPFTKQFSTRFKKPIMPNEKGRQIIFEYDLEEPEKYFRNAFLTDADYMKISMEFPTTLEKDPILFDINQETDEATVTAIEPKIEESEGRKCIIWEKENLTKGETFKMTW